jgi:hypothetical protein
VKSRFQRYGLLTASLVILFASGVFTGIQWVRRTFEPAGNQPPSSIAGPVSVTQWGENAAAALQKDLGLTEVQVESVRRTLGDASRLIFEEKQRGNFKIHLRLLEAHDTLAANGDLSDKQKALLKARREQLRRHILEKFRDVIGEHPDPVLSAL